MTAFGKAAFSFCGCHSLGRCAGWHEAFADFPLFLYNLFSFLVLSEADSLG